MPFRAPQAAPRHRRLALSASSPAAVWPSSRRLPCCLAGAGIEPAVGEGLALALAILLAGFLAMLLGRGSASGLLGLVAAENGALLAVVHAGNAMPGVSAALAVLSPGLLGCVALAAARGGRGGFAEALPRAVRR